MAGKLAACLNFGNIFEAPSDGTWGISYSTFATLGPVDMRVTAIFNKAEDTPKQAANAWMPGSKTPRTRAEPQFYE